MKNIYGKVKYRSTLNWIVTLALTLACITPARTTPGGNLVTYVNSQNATEPSAIMNIATERAVSMIDSFYRLRHKAAGFNGAVLVAKNGQVLYKAAFGLHDYHTKEVLTTQTPIQLASVSKPLTATAVLMLAENGFLSVDDTLQKFFPEFPYKGITVKHLLTHRSGLPEYIYWGKDLVGSDVHYLTNEKLLEVLIKRKPPVRTQPDRMFLYTNTNYALLALLVEKLTKLSFGQFMQDYVFNPLGMKNSFVYDFRDSIYHCGAKCFDARWRTWQENMTDGVTGDKGIYASVEDMALFDEALRTGKLLSETTLQEAYAPRSLDRYSFAKEKEKNYGYGWRMIRQADKSNLIYHNGNWHGCNNVFARDIQGGYTIVVLGNKANEGNYWTQPVWDIIKQLKTFESIAEVQ